MKKFIMSLSVIGLLFSCNSNDQQAKNDENEFKYLVDEFADIKIMRYQIPEWENLTLQQKEYLYYLGEAAKCGRDILADQNFKYNLTVRKTNEAILNSYKGDRNTTEFQNFLTYAKRVFFSNGIHHHYAEDKFVPEISTEYFAELVKNSDTKQLPLAENETVEEFLTFITPVMFDKDLYATRRSGDDDIIKNSATNFYKGDISKEEVERFYDAQRVPNDATPISYGLNSQLVKENGKIYENVYKSGGLYGEAIDQIIYWLEKANAVAENEAQRNYTNLLIDYYKTGDLKTWDEYNVAWVQDSVSTIDFVNGFIEDYGDPMGMKATWEAVVNFKDLEATKRSSLISQNAQWFEDNSPVDASQADLTGSGLIVQLLLGQVGDQLRTGFLAVIQCGFFLRYRGQQLAQRADPIRNRIGCGRKNIPAFPHGFHAYINLHSLHLLFRFPRQRESKARRKDRSTPIVR